jgi:hypothetical protein
MAETLIVIDPNVAGFSASVKMLKPGCKFTDPVNPTSTRNNGGAPPTCNVAGWLVADPAVLLTFTKYCDPESLG